MSRPALQPRDLTVDDLDAVIDIRARSIGLMAPGSREEWLRGARIAVEERRLIGVFDGDRLSLRPGCGTADRGE